MTKMYIARPSKYKPFYQLQKPHVIKTEDGEEYTLNSGQKEIELSEDEIETIGKITLDFLNLQSDLGFLFNGQLKYTEHNQWIDL